MVMPRVVRPSPMALSVLWDAIEDARAEVAEARTLDGHSGRRLVGPQRRLLQALDAYIRALDDAGLAAHGQLRSEAELLRAVTASRR